MGKGVLSTGGAGLGIAVVSVEDIMKLGTDVIDLRLLIDGAWC